ncbi:MAG: hypothetical protein ABJA67_06615, partial [Chthonomonadales bacterium]
MKYFSILVINCLIDFSIGGALYFSFRKIAPKKRWTYLRIAIPFLVFGAFVHYLRADPYTGAYL